MSCPDRQLLYLHAAEALDESERAALEAHLTGCADCTAALETEREMVARIVGALPAIDPPARIRERLLGRVHGTAPLPGAAPGRARPPLVRFARVGGLAAAAAVAGFVLASWRLAPAHDAALTRSEAKAGAAAEDARLARSEVERLEAQLAEQDEELAALEEDLEQAADVAQLLGTTGLVVLELAATAEGSEAWGRVLWDDEYRCYFRAGGLAPLPDERHYVVWMVAADGAQHAAGTLTAQRGGGAMLYTRIPRELTPVVRSFVTTETTESPDAPSGDVVLLGEAAIGG